MDVIWSQSRLMTLLQSFYTLIKTRVGFFDLDGQEIMAYPAARTAYCNLIRADKKGDAACRSCDRAAFRKAAEYKGPYIYQCHAGLTEMVAPIVTTDGERVGYLMIGQAKQPSDQIVSGNGELKKAYDELTVLRMEQIKACANILQSLAAYVWLDNYLRKQGEPLSIRVKTYVTSHLDMELSLNDIAGTFGVGRTTLCKEIKQDLNMTVNELIRSVRMEKAKRLLASGGGRLLIADIAEAVGIPDYNYFTKVFKEETGVTPSVYRRLCAKEFLYQQPATEAFS